MVSARLFGNFSRGASARLSPSEFASLIEKIAHDEQSQGASVNAEQIIIQDDDQTEYVVRYFIIKKKYECEKIKTFYLFPVVRDAHTTDEEKSVPPFSKIIDQLDIRNKFNQEKVHLLFPLFECRTYFKLDKRFPGVKKQHIVLVDWDVNAKKIITHDSKEKILPYDITIYPDRVGEIAKQYAHQYLRFYYGQQNMIDMDHCGFFCYEYLKSYFLNGSGIQLKTIRVSHEG